MQPNETTLLKLTLVRSERLYEQAQQLKEVPLDRLLDHLLPGKEHTQWRKEIATDVTTAISEMGRTGYNQTLLDNLSGVSLDETPPPYPIRTLLATAQLTGGEFDIFLNMGVHHLWIALPQHDCAPAKSTFLLEMGMETFVCWTDGETISLDDSPDNGRYSRIAETLEGSGAAMAPMDMLFEAIEHGQERFSFLLYNDDFSEEHFNSHSLELFVDRTEATRLTLQLQPVSDFAVEASYDAITGYIDLLPRLFEDLRKAYPDTNLSLEGFEQHFYPITHGDYLSFTFASEKLLAEQAEPGDDLAFYTIERTELVESGILSADKLGELLKRLKVSYLIYNDFLNPMDGRVFVRTYSAFNSVGQRQFSFEIARYSHNREDAERMARWEQQLASYLPNPLQENETYEFNLPFKAFNDFIDAGIPPFRTFAMPDSLKLDKHYLFLAYKTKGPSGPFEAQTSTTLRKGLSHIYSGIRPKTYISPAIPLPASNISEWINTFAKQYGGVCTPENPMHQDFFMNLAYKGAQLAENGEDFFIGSFVYGDTTNNTVRDAFGCNISHGISLLGADYDQIAKELQLTDVKDIVALHDMSTDAFMS